MGTPARADHKDASDFMLEEYSRIAQAFFALHAQKNQTLRTYIALMTIGSGAAALVFQVLPKVFPANLPIADLGLLGLLLLFLSGLGLTIFFSLLGIRGDMILYARTVNRVRAYFAVDHPEISDYLVLPTSASKPEYYEGPSHYFYWEMLLVGALNSALFSVGLALVFFDALRQQFWAVGVIGIAATAAHMVGYYDYASRRERKFEQSYPSKPPAAK